MQEKCLKMRSLTSELLFYTRDCLKISLKNYSISCAIYIACAVHHNGISITIPDVYASVFSQWLHFHAIYSIISCPFVKIIKSINLKINTHLALINLSMFDLPN